MSCFVDDVVVNVVVVVVVVLRMKIGLYLNSTLCYNGRLVIAGHSPYGISLCINTVQLSYTIGA